MSAGGTAPVLEMRGVRKAFPGVVALDGVDLTLHAGDVHMLLGENGAGKSTLMKILSGAYRKDAGEIRIDGQPVDIGSPRDALALGIRVIYQELNLVPQLSVAENIFLGAMPTRWAGVVDWRALFDRASHLLTDLGLDASTLDARTPVSRLGMAQRQMVEIAKALAAFARDPAARHRQGSAAGIEGPRDGRADLVADQPRGHAAVLPDRAADGARRGDRLHHPPARRSVPHRPARHGAARRTPCHDPPA